MKRIVLIWFVSAVMIGGAMGVAQVKTSDAGSEFAAQSGYYTGAFAGGAATVLVVTLPILLIVWLVRSIRHRRLSRR